MDLIETEQRIRTFLAEELMKQKALVADRSAPLDLDSLEVTELRVFLSDEFGTKFDASTQINFDTIQNIISYLHAPLNTTVAEVSHAAAA